MTSACRKSMNDQAGRAWPCPEFGASKNPGWRLTTDDWMADWMVDLGFLPSRHCFHKLTHQEEYRRWLGVLQVACIVFFGTFYRKVVFLACCCVDCVFLTSFRQMVLRLPRSVPTIPNS